MEVVVLEKNERIGGKLGAFEADGFRWDTGPSLLTMPDILREFWSEMGKNLDDYLSLVRLDPVCRYRWDDGTIIDEDSAFWERKDVAKFMHYARGLYEISEDTFLRSTIETWWRQLRLTKLAKLRHLPKIRTSRSMHSTVRRYFRRDPHLIQLFDRFATYNGSSPYKTPSAFNIIPYVEGTFGAWYVQGGLYRIAEAMAKLATEAGVRIVTHAEVTGFRRLPGGYALNTAAGYCAASIIVCNQDALSAATNYMGMGHQRRVERELRRRELSTSGFIMMLGVRKRHEGLSHHNVFFSGDYRREFRQLFREKRPPQEPTIYVSVDCLTEPWRAPEGCENWFVLVNTPSLRDQFDWTAEAEAYSDLVLDRLARFGFTDLREHIVTRRILTPVDLKNRVNAYAGSIYGFASHGGRNAFQRHPLQVSDLPGIYFVGGSTHPGGGIPLVVLSGDIAARKIISDAAG